MHRRQVGKLKEVATALYSKQISVEEIEASGFAIEDFVDDYVEVWPENQEVFRIFAMFQTQWRTGASGPTGLDYNPIFTAMNLMQIDPPTQLELLDDLRVMEAAALTEITRKKD